MLRSCLVVLLSLFAVLSAACLARAEALIGPARGPLLRSGSTVIEVSLPASNGNAGSLFAGRAGTGLFAPTSRGRGAATSFGPGASEAARLRDLIGRAEAGAKGYDAVQHGARIRPPRAPTAMTLAEIGAWIDATPGQPHAIGRYQFIPATLRRLSRALGLPPEARFSPDVQDRLADRLLAEAGLAKMQAGEISRTRFMNALARIWAGFPTSSGRSHYHGYAGNRATMTWAQFDAAIAAIFPG